MTIHPIASSSKGNAYLVAQGSHALLIDCGVPCKRLNDFEFDAVLLTHDHVDHVKGLVPLLNSRDVPVYANAMTADKVGVDLQLAPDAFYVFENAQEFEVAGFSVLPFPIPHDATDPVGYLVRSGGETYFHGTDIGSPLDSIGRMLAEADFATLEANHDPVMLETSARPLSLKRRVAGPRGHLSNDDAAELVRRFASPKLRKLYLAHLSHECNAPHCALRTLAAALAEIGRSDITLELCNT